MASLRSTTVFSSLALRHGIISRRSSSFSSLLSTLRTRSSFPPFLPAIHTSYTRPGQLSINKRTLSNMSGPGASNDALLASNLFSVEGLVCLVTGVSWSTSCHSSYNQILLTPSSYLCAIRAALVSASCALKHSPQTVQKYISQEEEPRNWKK